MKVSVNARRGAVNVSTRGVIGVICKQSQSVATQRHSSSMKTAGLS